MKSAGTTSAKAKLKALRKSRAKRRFAFMRQVRRDISLSTAAKVVLMSLADDFYNLETEQCNPGYTAIGANVGRTGRQAQRSIKELETAGWITSSSVGGGSKASTNQYTLMWDKVANTTHDTASERTTQNEEAGPNTTQDTTFHTAIPEDSPGVTPESHVEYGEYTEIIDEAEIEGCHTCPPSSPETGHEGRHVRQGGVSYMSNEPLLNPSEEEEGGKPSSALRAPDVALALEDKEELAFQKLCQLWPRYQFWHDFDEAKCRAAFEAVVAKHGDEIRTKNNGAGTGEFLLWRAQVWIDAFVAAHPDGDGPRYLKKLEVWLGAPPDGQNKATPWWYKEPTPKVSGARSGKPDLMAVALNGNGR
jgi:hypothetical protein